MTAALQDYDSDTFTTIPGFRRVSRPRVETYSDFAPFDGRRQSTVLAAPSILPLFSFRAGGEMRRLRSPLLLRVSFEDGQYFVQNDSLRIFGHGDSLYAAVEAFAHDLAYLWDYYRNLKSDEVAGDAVQLKRIYEDLVA